MDSFIVATAASNASDALPSLMPSLSFHCVFASSTRVFQSSAASSSRASNPSRSKLVVTIFDFGASGSVPSWISATTSSLVSAFPAEAGTECPTLRTNSFVRAFGRRFATSGMLASLAKASNPAIPETFCCVSASRTFSLNFAKSSRGPHDPATRPAIAASGIQNQFFINTSKFYGYYIIFISPPQKQA